MHLGSLIYLLVNITNIIDIEGVLSRKYLYTKDLIAFLVNKVHEKELTSVQVINQYVIPKTINVGLNTHKSNPWQGGINNALLALDSITKGLVITRTSSASIPALFEGMLIYDTTDKCFKLYSETIWKCISRQCKEN